MYLVRWVKWENNMGITVCTSVCSRTGEDLVDTRKDAAAIIMYMVSEGKIEDIKQLREEIYTSTDSFRNDIYLMTRDAVSQYGDVRI